LNGDIKLTKQDVYMKKLPIKLISYGQFESEFLSNIAESISNEFAIPVEIEEKYIELSSYYDPGRRQYDANKLLKLTDSYSTVKSIKRIGLFRVDLFIPILTYIFGQAFLNGHTGIASVYRLRNELYGIEPSEEKLRERFKKVIIHELGHTFGLKHCHTPSCVMLSSTYMEDIDQKDKSFCTKCRVELAL
jgi:archaemetzincin